MVKKRLADGQPCRKCVETEALLRDDPSWRTAPDPDAAEPTAEEREAEVLRRTEQMTADAKRWLSAERRTIGRLVPQEGAVEAPPPISED